MQRFAFRSLTNLRKRTFETRSEKRGATISHNGMATTSINDDFLRDAMIGGFRTFDFTFPDIYPICQERLRLSIQQDNLLVCRKFWRTFKSEVGTEWILIGKCGRTTKVKVKECEDNIVVIYEGWSKFRKVNEVYSAREIMFAYVGACTFHVRFWKEDPELATLNKELKKKIGELGKLLVSGNPEGKVKTCSSEARNEFV